MRGQLLRFHSQIEITTYTTDINNLKHFVAFLCINLLFGFGQMRVCVCVCAL